MGNGGKFVEREQARRLRAQSWTLQEIADELGVAKGSVSVWVRDVDFVPKPRNRGHSSHQPHPLHVKKLAEIERCKAEADQLFARLTPRERDLFALGLYAGEGEKSDKRVSMANTNPVYLRVFVTWLREEFVVDEARLRVRLYSTMASTSTDRTSSGAWRSQSLSGSSRSLTGRRPTRQYGALLI